ncbi:MvdC family ATP-grasp ribosomal peptide maturase [Vibrio sp. vnigr-6D03]|uniref:MvdC/MvdD family ATP grasp protein n=1 Tax=Vibrio sp. vnigr-6D03 TaxID=2058088 RepID=UPI000C332943|nr:MvdC family ATP-grasp ribosomal peptide maturase [Vibrio sp. vnigr-6D03]PKF79852.1 MvdC family ATP-grasp ribosomal peptide maturase [Vibrio sp. vnigr-6D03]
MQKTNKSILCITHSEDTFPVDWVTEHLMTAGVEAVRLNSDQFPLNIQIGGSLQTLPFDSPSSEEQHLEKAHVDTLISTEGWSINESNIGAIWHRKNRVSDLSSALEGDVLAQATRESECIKQSLLYSFEDVFWLDHPNTQLAGENKWLQLRMAKKAGLDVPATLFTNIPDQVKAFYKQCNGDIVAKMHTPLTVSMGKPPAFVYTSKVTEAHLADLDSLRFSPMIFQQQVKKQAELRIAYVDGHCFPAKVNLSSNDEKELLDWRKATPTQSNWQHTDIPESLVQKLRVFMDSMNLKFGAIDIILDTTRKYQFLEVNPAGEWGMLEAELDLPISKQIAQTLIKYSQ